MYVMYALINAMDIEQKMRENKEHNYVYAYRYITYKYNCIRILRHTLYILLGRYRVQSTGGLTTAEMLIFVCCAMSRLYENNYFYSVENARR